MNCIAWNCQGLGRRLAVQSLSNLVKVTKPQLVFLSETKATVNYMNTLRIKLGFAAGLHVERQGYGGGLSLLWNESIDVSILSYSSGHIDAQIQDHLGLVWRFTGFYGHPKKEHRYHSWTLLRRLSTLSTLPWLCAGDFNEIMYQEEKQGARTASLTQMENFKSAVEDSDLQDLGCSNGTFTWFGRRYSTYVRERLDRALANTDWQNLFPQSKVMLHVTSKSDHMPLIISLTNVVLNAPSCCTMIHRFETFWTTDEECREIISYKWQPRTNQNPKDLMEAIHGMRKALKNWSSTKYGTLPKHIENTRSQFHDSIQNPQADQCVVRNLQQKLQDLENKEEMYWRQRSRVEWLNHGDRNTRYFHHKADFRRKRNQITSVVDAQGIEYSQPEDIVNQFTAHFANLFNATSTDLSILNTLQFAQLSYASKNLLQSVYTIDEICKAVKDLPATKAPGSDGMQLVFLKKYWDIIGPDISSFVLDFLNNGGDLQPINHTLICLVPKIKQATKVTDFRPISLCNSMYKLISRVLVNRLKIVIGEVIDDAQAAFVPGRLLTDNAAVACEAFHIFKTQQSAQKGYLGIKLDMAKAFDKVQWNYLQEIMRRMGFPAVFINRIISCVTSTSLSLIINGKATPSFSPTSGIRQGDPLSPFLFVLCSEGFSALIRRELSDGAWQGLNFGRQGPHLSHLFFADDSLLFIEASMGGVAVVKKVLTQYSQMSGQCINFQKSNVYCSRNVSAPNFAQYCTALDMVPGNENSLYLGLPFLIGRSKKRIFQYVIDRVRKKLNGWKEKFLTQAGKEVLIKSVIQAIPNHVMQCFELPNSVCEDLVSLTRNFWWGKSCASKSIYWKSWEDMCSPKGSGGMGFKEIKATNLSLLAKQGWCMIQCPNSLLARAFKARYFQNTDFMHAQLGHRPSYLWRSILAGRTVLELGIRYQVGSGQNISVWDDRWLPMPYTFQANSINRHKWPQAKVCDLMVPDSSAWNQEMIEYLFFPHEVSVVLQIPLCVASVQDRIVWHHSRDGEYTVKTGYIAYKQFGMHTKGCSSSNNSNSKKSVWNKLWSWKTLPKIKHFIWKAMHNVLPIGINLSKRTQIAVSCPHCNCSMETDRHLFFECPYARKVWNLMGLSALWTQSNATSFLSLVNQLFFQEESHTISLFLITTWLLWKSRCTKNFEKQFTPERQLVSVAYDLAQEIEVSSHTEVHEISGQLQLSDAMPNKALVHVDAAVDGDGRTSFGLLVRDPTGMLIDAKSGPLPNNIEVEHAELLALLEGMHCAQSLNLQRVHVVTDSLLAYNRVTAKERDYSLVSPIVYQMRHLHSKFQDVSFGFVRRAGNKPAHLLAKLGLQMCNPLNWGTTPPIDVLIAVNLDSVFSNE